MKSLINRNEKGFTLIELMIVIAIIGILAAIAIPNFLRYQLKSKTAEAKTNLGAIKTSQEAFRAEWDAYIPCGLTLATPSDIKQDWTPAKTNAGFTTLGWAPSGKVYYSYEVATKGGTEVDKIAGTTLKGFSGGFTASAAGDLDKDGVKANNGEFAYSSSVGAVDTTSQITGVNTVSGAVQDVNAGGF